MSVPGGVDNIRDKWFIVSSVLLRYNGSQLRRVWRDGGVDGFGTGIALSGGVPAGGIPDTSDMVRAVRRRVW